MNNNFDEWYYFQVNLYECDVIEVGSNQSIHDVMREVVKED